MNRHSGRDDGGETLLELLISLMIIGIGVVAILGAVRIAVDASSLDERQIHAQALLRSWGEFAVAQTTDASYPATCATASVLAYPASLQTLPPGFTAQLSKVEYWDGTGFATACTTDSGVRRLVLKMTVDTALYPGFASTYDVVVRRPCRTLGVGGC